MTPKEDQMLDLNRILDIIASIFTKATSKRLATVLSLIAYYCYLSFQVLKLSGPVSKEVFILLALLILVPGLIMLRVINSFTILPGGDDLKPPAEDPKPSPKTEGQPVI